MAARGCGRVDALFVVVGTHSTRECVLFHIKYNFRPDRPTTFGERADSSSPITRSLRRIRLDEKGVSCAGRTLSATGSRKIERCVSIVLTIDSV